MNHGLEEGSAFRGRLLLGIVSVANGGGGGGRAAGVGRPPRPSSNSKASRGGGVVIEAQAPPVEIEWVLRVMVLQGNGLPGSAGAHRSVPF